MAQRRLKVLPDKMFHKMWADAFKMDEKDYVLKWNSAENIRLFERRYNIDSAALYRMTENIYASRSMSIQEIVEKSGYRKSEFADVHCIPIRTLESWYVNSEKMTPTTKLFLLRAYKLIVLDKYIILKSEDKYVPKPTPKQQPKVEETTDDDDWFEKRMAEIHKRTEEHSKFRLDSNASLNDLLNRTDYLSGRLKK